MRASSLLRDLVPGGAQRAALLLMIALAHGSPAHAQNDRNTREREQIRKLQSVNTQLQQEKAALEEAKAKAEQQVREAAKEAEALKSAVKAETRKRAQAEQELTKAQATVEAGKAEAKALGDKLQAAAASHEALLAARKKVESALQASIAEGARLEKTGVAQAGAIAACNEANANLHALGLELLDRYDRKGVWSIVKRAEPLTGIANVEVENLLQSYRDKLDASRLAPSRR